MTILKGKISHGRGLSGTSTDGVGAILQQRMAMKYLDNRYNDLLKELDEKNILNKTINVSIKNPIVFTNPDFCVDDLLWDHHTFGDFAYIRGKIQHNKKTYNCFLYKPQLSHDSYYTKNESRYTLQVLAPEIKELKENDIVFIYIPFKKIKELSFVEKFILYFIKDSIFLSEFGFIKSIKKKIDKLYKNFIYFFNEFFF